MNIGILENDFGAVNVDMMLLQDLMGDNCELEMVSGGCDADCHRPVSYTHLSLVAIIGATVDLGLLWSIAETFNGLMAIPNLIAVFLPVSYTHLDVYKRQVQ